MDTQIPSETNNFSVRLAWESVGRNHDGTWSFEGFQVDKEELTNAPKTNDLELPGCFFVEHWTLCFGHVGGFSRVLF